VPDDAEPLQALGIKSFVAAFGHLYSKEDLDAFMVEVYDLEGWRRQTSQADRPIWIAECPDGRFAGYAQASPCGLPVDPMPKGALQLRRLYARPDMLSVGIGAALMKPVLEWVDAAGRPPLFLGVWSENLKAQKFYGRYGFTRFGQYDFSVGSQIDLEFILRRD
jgi:GNAT superfamily N-acetyltransferase